MSNIDFDKLDRLVEICDNFENSLRKINSKVFVSNSNGFADDDDNKSILEIKFSRISSGNDDDAKRLRDNILEKLQKVDGLKPANFQSEDIATLEIKPKKTFVINAKEGIDMTDDTLNALESAFNSIISELKGEKDKEKPSVLMDDSSEIGKPESSIFR